MKPVLLLCTGVLTAGLTGCIPSLHPLYTEEDLGFDPALVGAWAAQEGKEVWRFENSDGKAYWLTYSSDGKVAHFDARLLWLNETLFLDLYPAELGQGNEFYRAHFVPAHTFYRASLRGDRLRLWTLNPDKLKKRLDVGAAKLAHEKVGDGLLLTAFTKELQRFMLTVLEEPEMFSELYHEDGGLRRQP